MTGKNTKKRNSRFLAKAAVQHGAFQKISEFKKLLQLLIKQAPKVIVEIGTARGGTFYSFCRVADPKATIISIDLPDGKFGGGYTDNEMKRISKYKLKGQDVHFIRKDSHLASTKKELEKILNGREIDFIMIDGDHTYEGVKQDYTLYQDLVKSNGIIAFHDILFHPKVPTCRVDKFWNEIKDQYKTEEFIERGDDRGWGEWGGIGVIYKKIENVKPESEIIVKQEDGNEYIYRSFFISPFPKFDKVQPKQSLGFILDNDHKLLMTSQDGKFWELPGGTIEPNEKPKDTVLREVYEETAVLIDKKSIVDFFYSTVHKLINGKEEFYALQLRYIAKVSKIDKFTKDPGGEHKYRKFIDTKDFSKTFGWEDKGKFLQNKLIQFISDKNI